MWGQCPLECRALLFEDGDSLGKAYRVAALRESGFHVVLEAVERWHQPGAVLLHQLRAFFVEHRAVLDGIDSGADGGLDALAAFGVGHYFLSGAVGNFDGLCHLFLAQFLHAVVADGVHDAAGGHELDPVGAVFDVAADNALDVVGSVGDVGLVGKSEVGGEHVAVAVSAGERDAAAGGDDSGAANQALLDAVAQGELPIAAVAFAGVAHGGEAVVQPGL